MKSSLHILLTLLLRAVLPLAFAGSMLCADTVGYWRFESGNFTADSSGNSLTLGKGGSGGDNLLQTTLAAEGAGANFPKTIPQTGATNSTALSWNGVGLNYKVEDNALFALTEGVTIEAFVNLSALPTGKSASIAAQRGNSTATGWGFFVSTTGELVFQYQSASGQSWGAASATWESLASGLTLTAGKDYYVAFAMDLADTSVSGATFYLQNLSDGGDIQTVSVTHSFTTINHPAKRLYIGTSENSDVFSGLLDEVRLSNTRLSQDQLLVSSIPEPAAAAAFVCAGMLAFVVAARRFRSSGS